MLRRFLFHHAALGAAFTLAGGGRALDADDVSMADLGRPCGYFNGAVLLRPPDDWDAVLTRVERFLDGGSGRPVCGVHGRRPTCAIAAGDSAGIRHCSSVRHCRQTP